MRAPEDGTVYPASPAQERLYPPMLADPEVSRAYNMSEAHRVTGPLDTRALAAAFTAVTARHHALRTSLRRDAGGTVRQVLHSPGPRPLAHVDLTDDLAGLPDTGREDAVRRRVAADAEELFPLDGTPLSRFTLYRLGEDDHLVLAVVHHSVFDGWSMGLLWREVSELYRAAVTGTPPALPESPLQFTEFAAEQHAWIGTPRARKLLDRCRKGLTGFSHAVTFPYDNPAPERKTFNGKRRVFTLPEDTSDALSRLARAEHVTLAAVSLSALRLLLRGLTGSQDVTLGIPMANRTRASAFDAMGYFANAYVLRARPSDEGNLRELLGLSAVDLAEALTCQAVPFPAVLASLEDEYPRPPRLFRVLFTFHNEPAPPLDLTGTRSTRHDLGGSVSTTDVTFHVGRRDDRMTYEFQYNPDLYREATVEHFAAGYEQALRHLLDDLDRTIGEAATALG
ncbi:hypothetical protein AF335_17645 [Streptomyces eurocidicus]|uniref:Condensation domain-containing protein n=1 Tax=Streptomyces eurocidicus TaxID=66423 RepID=A0A2N8NUH9_STREU|nr:condensation domain-containing protein [Streptomyces eurocidicus]MBB5120287.1 hypothetical protein [Streptomyces eurocidicus]MBF6056033.1 hypothetical protein [Streptomyces eurocidicus]PNE32425.1 hypothetical protein AF335_17645 [Streptomyces eurocidicus]